ncbi:MAG: hypothetical protein WCP35_22335, partial [Verrucomicrobiota bacterium]
EFAFALPTYTGAGNAWWIEPATSPSGALNGVFVRPKLATANVSYSLQYAATPGNPTVWTTLALSEMTGEVVTITDNGDCTETVTLHNLESITSLSSGGTGIVRIKADLVDGATTATSYTEVEGWKETTLASCGTFNNPYLRETAFTGTVTSVTGQVLAFANLVELTFAPSGSCYLEVTSGNYAGQRFDVDSASGYNITLATDIDLNAATAPFNTRLTMPDLTGELVVIRQHWTLGQMFPVANFTAGTTHTTADQVQTYAAGAWSTYWLYTNSGSPKWVKVGDGTMADQAATIIPPGQGMFVNRRTTPLPYLAYGEVRSNTFVRPLSQGTNLVGGGYPIAQSPNGSGGRSMNLAASFFGSRDFKTADSIFVWKGDATPGVTTYDTYYLLSNSPTNPTTVKWVKVGDVSLSSYDAASILLGDRSVFIRANAALPSYSTPSPWSP